MKLATLALGAALLLPGVAAAQTPTPPAQLPGGVASINGCTGVCVLQQPQVLEPVINLNSGTTYSTVPSGGVVEVNKTSATAITIIASPTGTETWIADVGNNAATFNITVTCAGLNINHTTSYVMATNGEAIDVFDDGSQCWIKVKTIP